MKKNLYSIVCGIFLCSSVFSQVVSSGRFHSLFTCNIGSAKSAGLNLTGQLGDGTTANKLSPVQVSGFTANIMAVSGGKNHSLFLKNDGTVWACGYNNYGQLGDGTNTQRNSPVQVSGLTGITAIANKENHSLFLKSDSTVWACGFNASGVLGDGTTVDKSTPVQVSGLTGIIAIAAGGDHSIFLKSDGTVWACGNNTQWQIGDGTGITRTTPVQVSGLTGIIAITTGYYHSLFLKSDGTVWASGSNNGTYGDGNINSSPVPVQSLITGVIAIGAGTGGYSLFVKNDGTVWGSGANSYGQLGNGNTTDVTTPVQASGLANIIAATGGNAFSLFVKNDGTVWACGQNSYGQLGIGNMTEQHTPVQITSLCSVVGVEEQQWQEEAGEIQVYPNPTSGLFNVQMSKLANLPVPQAGVQMNSIEVYNVFGECIHQHISTSAHPHIDLSEAPEGIYFVKIETAQGIVSKKVVVAR
ncbi:MAG: T9SS type A sorting domain-containing protein [Bacteroidetes bacterium]|nr:T9SS type A sorting domain-containing protein [Bacteroidota bacterium]